MAQAAAKQGLRVRKLAPKKPALSFNITLSDRHTDELVIGLVGPVGAGVSTSAKLLQSKLESAYGYTVAPIKMSDLIIQSAALVGQTVPKGISGYDRISKLQEIGSLLRKQFGPKFIAEKCVEKIGVERYETDGYENVGEKLVVKPRRHVHIIDSLKNPGEVSLLREVYGSTFWLIGVFAPEDVRQARLKASGLNDIQVQTVMSVDEAEGVDHGQRVRDTIHEADFFIRNDGNNDDRLTEVITRYLRIMFNIGVNTPTQDEAGMYKAMSAASSSACLSRQVGAAIYTAGGEFIGVGSNDVPKFGGGLYSVGDGQDDHRCYKWGGKICHNDHGKTKLYERAHEALHKKGLLAPGASKAQIEGALRQTEIKNLIEYSRAVHAEMEAIISVARGHKAGIVGATMYSTAYPCHACASLIVASGIHRVLYIEPYAKSLALALHGDAISTREQDGKNHVLFLQYEGVAPKNIIRLFNHGAPRKDARGKLVVTIANVATPVFPSPLDGFSHREQIVVTKVRSLEQPSSAESQPNAERRGAPPAQLPLGDTK